MLNHVWVNSTATDAASLDADLRDAVSAYVMDREIDVSLLLLVVAVVAVDADLRAATG